jgi:hypothetical protein
MKFYAAGIALQQFPKSMYRLSILNAFDAHFKYEIALAIVENIPLLREKLTDKKKSWDAESYSMSTFEELYLAFTHYYKSN